MNNDPEFDDIVSGHQTSAADAAAAELAMAAADRGRANAFLDSQTAIAHVQREHLHEQRALQISHLRWRRFNDWMRAGWQTMLGLAAALALVAIGTAMWDASQARGLVVDALTVPPDFERRGMGGDVIAGDFTSRLAAIRRIAVAHSFSSTESVSQSRANEIRVEIPYTGISIAEAWHYLRGWLGHERHLTGSLRETFGGGIVLSASLDDGTVYSATGAPSDLAKLEHQVAEDVFGDFDPVNHIVYLAATGRYRASYDAAARYVPLARGELQRADSFELWGNTTEVATGDLALAGARARIGMQIDPNLAVAHIMAFRYCDQLGKDECALREARAVLPLKDEDQTPAHRGSGFAAMKDLAFTEIASLSGDFWNGATLPCTDPCTPLLSHFLSQSRFLARLHDVSGARRMLAKAVAAGASYEEVMQRPFYNFDRDAMRLVAASAPHDEAMYATRYYIDAAAGDWPSAIADATAARWLWLKPDGSDISRRYLDIVAETHYDPLLAEGEARAGRFAAAHATIDRSPADCVPCNTARGEIDALQGVSGPAAWWFSRSIAEAPSVPYACVDWGQMLLYEGKYDAAMAKFEIAHEKAPHFADPLEMWGEALMQENRSDLALAKFEEANKYAPNWGRLHLEWGKALYYAGRKDEAQKQFTLASHLDLSPTDAAALRRTRGSRV